MVKEKKRIVDAKIKNKEFYHEIIGISLILISLIIISELGSFGLGLKIFLKLIFGDWYLIFVFLISLTGVKLIIKHKGLNIKSLRFQGILLLFFSLMILSHISVHKFLLKILSNPISGLFKLYKSYIESYSSDYVFGGGVIGGLFYEAINYLLGNIGLILVLIVLMLFSFIFLTNNSLLSFYKKIRFDGLKFNKTLILIKSYFKNIDLSNVKRFKPNKINISYLSDYEITLNYNIQQNKANEYKSLINNLLNSYKTEFRYLKHEVGYLYTKFEYQILHSFDIDSFIEKLKKLIEMPIYIKFSEILLEIEINNQFKELATLKNIWLQNEKKLIPLGLKIDKTPLYLDYELNKNILVVANKDMESKNFIMSFFVSSLLSGDDIKYIIFDGYKNFEELKLVDVVDYYETDIKYYISNLDQISETLDKRIEIFKMLKVNNFVEFNNNIIKGEELKSIPRLILLINGIEFIDKSNVKENGFNKLIYLTQVGERYGIHIIAIMNEICSLPSSLKSMFATKLIYKQYSHMDSLSFLDDEYALYLNKSNEFIYRYQDLMIRLQSPYILEKDYNNIVKKL